MLRLTFASLRSRPLRAILTALSIVLGVAMISGTFVLTGQIDRAFSEIFDAANAKNDVVDRARTVSKNNAAASRAVPRLGPDRAQKVPGVAAATGEIDALGSLVTFKNGTPKRVTLDRRRSAARVLAVAAALPDREVRERPRRPRQRRDRAARGHRQEGEGHDRHGGRPRDARRPQAAARRRHLQDRHRGVARRRARQLDPARRRPALVRLRERVHADQPAGRSRRVPRRPARSRASGRRQPLQGADRHGEGARRTRRGSPTSSTASWGPRCWRSAAWRCSSAPS